MANIAFTQMSVATSALGNAIIPIVQNNLNYTVTVDNLLSTAGNVTAGKFFGDGSGLTNVGTYGNANVANYLPIYTGNLDNTNNISATGNVSATYFIGSGALLTGGYGNSNVATYLPTYSGNLRGGNVSAVGNVSGGYLLGNISLATGGYGNSNVAAYLPTYTGNIEAGNIDVAQTVSAFNVAAPFGAIGNMSGLTLLVQTSSSLNGTVYANTITATGNISAQNFIGNGSQLTGVVATVGVLPALTVTGNVSAGNVSVAGNVTLGTGSRILGDFSAVTRADRPLFQTTTQGMTSIGAIPNATYAGSVSGTTAVVGYYVYNKADPGNSSLGAFGISNSALSISSGFNGTGASIPLLIQATAGVSVQGNINQAAPYAVNAVAINAGNISASGTIQSASTVSGASGQFNSVFSTGQLSGTGNVDGGNIRTAGQITATGNIQGNVFLGNGSQLTGVVASSVTYGNNIALGTQAAGNATNGIAIGYRAGNTGQSLNGIAIGTNAANTAQGANSIAIGFSVGTSGQGQNAIAIGVSSAGTNQGANSVVIGARINQHGASSVIIGPQAGAAGTDAVSIGSFAGATNMNNNGVAIGSSAGNQGLGAQAIAIGYRAGYNSAGGNAISMGYYAGYSMMGINSISLGTQAGGVSQGATAIAIGNNAGNILQSANSIAIGFNAGFTAQGINSVAIGVLAGNALQANNSIILNATGAVLNQTTANSFTVKPVRSATGTQALYYNNTSGEVTYSPAAPALNYWSGLANANPATAAGATANWADSGELSGSNIAYIGNGIFTLATNGVYELSGSAGTMSLTGAQRGTIQWSAGNVGGAVTAPPVFVGSQANVGNIGYQAGPAFAIVNTTGAANATVSLSADIAGGSITYNLNNDAYVYIRQIG